METVPPPSEDPAVVIQDVGNGVKEEQIVIPEFPKELLKPGKLIVIVGKRGSGKSVLAHYIFRWMADEFDFCIGITETQSSAEMFEEIMPPSCVYNRFEETAIPRLIEALRALRFKGKMRRVLVVMDDLMAIRGLMNRQEIKDIHLNGRHIQIFFVNLVQYAIDVPKNLRSQIDLVFTFAQHEPTFIKPLYDNYFSRLSYHDFLTLLPILTEDYGCMVCDRNAQVTGRFSGIYYFKANPNDKSKYLLGNRSMWKLHHMFYKPQIPPNISAIPVLCSIDGRQNFRSDVPQAALVEPQDVAGKKTTTAGKRGGKAKQSEVIRTTIIKRKRVNNDATAVPAQMAISQMPTGNPPERRVVTELELGAQHQQVHYQQQHHQPAPAAALAPPRIPSRPTVVFA